MGQPNYIEVLRSWLEVSRQELLPAAAVIRAAPEFGKAVAELALDERFVATVEVWNTGELDFTLAPGSRSRGRNVEFENQVAVSERDMRLFLDRCL